MTFCTYDGLGCGVLARAAILGNIYHSITTYKHIQHIIEILLSSSCLLWPPCVADADIIFFCPVVSSSSIFYFMAALCNRAGHIFIPSFVLLLLFSFLA